MIWVGIGLVPFLVMTQRWWEWTCTALILLAVWYSGQGAFFSPNNRIDIQTLNLLEKSTQAKSEWELSVNRDFHQNLLDLSSPAVQGLSGTSNRKFVKYFYEIPFRVQKEGATALVVGAGTGNDVAAALRCKYSRVVSIEIDPVIMKMGQELHPEKPCASPPGSTCHQ